MGNEATAEVLPTATEQSGEGMGDKSVSQAQYVAQLAKQETAKRAAAAKPAEANNEDQATADVESETATPVDEETEATAEGDKAEDQEQSEEQPETEDSPVLSKLDPKTQEKIQKRIGKVTARAKDAEEKLALAQQEIETLKASSTQDAPPVVVTADDPSDKTATANSEADLAQLEADARNTIEFLEAHEIAITRALAKEQDTVMLGGQEFSTADLMEFRRNARRHLERLIPARRQHLAEKTKATAEAKTILPALFDKNTPEHQEFVAFQRKHPAARGIPSFEKMYALAKIGEQTVAAQAKKPAAKASAATPKTGADTGSAASAAKPKSGGGSAEKAKLTVELAKAQKAFEASSSQRDYQQVLILQSRLKKLN